MKYNPTIYNRQSIRLPAYDYSGTGYYFVTICSYKRELIFGEIKNDEMKLSPTGIIIEKYILIIEQHFENVKIDASVIMPNHVHFIIIIDCRRGGVIPPNDIVLLNNDYNNKQGGMNELGGITPPLRALSKPTLGQIVGYYKYQTTKRINHVFNNSIDKKIWQRNYYEHIIRDENSLNRIRQYIKNNPVNWKNDRNNL
ncbi:MAG: transposase [Patescibacteria group bacterium]|jgi:REP element-mobilizing transposase RayT